MATESSRQIRGGAGLPLLEFSGARLCATWRKNNKWGMEQRFQVTHALG